MITGQHVGVQWILFVMGFMFYLRYFNRSVCFVFVWFYYGSLLCKCVKLVSLPLKRFCLLAVLVMLNEARAKESRL